MRVLIEVEVEHPGAYAVGDGPAIAPAGRHEGRAAPYLARWVLMDILRERG